MEFFVLSAQFFCKSKSALISNFYWFKKLPKFDKSSSYYLMKWNIPQLPSAIVVNIVPICDYLWSYELDTRKWTL